MERTASGASRGLRAISEWSSFRLRVQARKSVGVATPSRVPQEVAHQRRRARRRQVTEMDRTGRIVVLRGGRKPAVTFRVHPSSCNCRAGVSDMPRVFVFRVLWILCWAFLDDGVPGCRTAGCCLAVARLLETFVEDRGGWVGDVRSVCRSTEL